MNPDPHRATASAGGKAAAKPKRVHRFSSEEARRAGRVGGLVVSKNREYMAAIGRKGGRAPKAGKSAAEVKPNHGNGLSARSSAPDSAKCS